MKNEELRLLGEKYVMKTYARQPFTLVRGEGSFVWDADGKKYLDLLGGIAVNNLGHCHPKVTNAIKEQAEKLLHCSNLYWIEPQIKLARLLVENSCGKKVFFCNSGAEANEAAIKMARKWAFSKAGTTERYEIITAFKSFHGRTLTTVAATGQEKYQKGFDPLTPGFKYVPFNDLDAMKEAVSTKTCAIMLEPIQGEGGVNTADEGYLEGVKEICQKKDLLLIFDEVQTGLGRTGKLFAYEHYGVEPDIFTLAKGLGGGVPIGAAVAHESVAEVFKPGDHASTFGGNPLATAASLAALTAIIEEKLPEAAYEKGRYIRKRIKELDNKLIINTRGKGLLVGIELSVDAKQVQEKCQDQGVLVNCVQQKILRLAPPLNISYEEIEIGLEVIMKALIQ